MTPADLFSEFTAGFPARKFSAGLLMAFIDLYTEIGVPHPPFHSFFRGKFRQPTHWISNLFCVMPYFNLLRGSCRFYFNYLALVDSVSTVRTLSPDLTVIAHMDRAGVIVTALGDKTYDFVSRYFAPAKGIPEDPVTGGAHCMLTPFWAKKLGKTDFHAFQAS